MRKIAEKRGKFLFLEKMRESGGNAAAKRRESGGKFGDRKSGKEAGRQKGKNVLCCNRAQKRAPPRGTDAERRTDIKHTFIKLYRDITSWQWYRDGNTFRVYLHLMLLAQFYEVQKGKEIIRPGDVETTYDRLTSDLGLSVSQIRTAFSRLINSGEITVRKIYGGMRIHVNHYDKPPGHAERMCDDTAQQSHIDRTSIAHTSHIFLNIKNAKNAKNAEREEECVCPPTAATDEAKTFSFEEDGFPCRDTFGSASEPDGNEDGIFIPEADGAVIPDEGEAPEETAEGEQSVYPGENGNLMIDAVGLRRLREALPGTWREKAEYLSAYLAAHPGKQYADHVSLILLWAMQDREKQSAANPDPWERMR